MRGGRCDGIPYNAKFLWVFNFMNFAKFQPFVKIY